MLKLHKTLAIVAAVQVVLVAVMWLRGGVDASVTKPHVLLPGFDASKVTKVEIEAGSGDGVELAKQGSDWVVASAWNTPVRGTAIDGFLSALAKMSAASPIATSASKHEALQLTKETAVREVTITADGKDATLLIGKGLGGGRTAVRFANDDDAYAVSGISAASAGADVKSWMDTQVLSVAPNGIRKLAVARGGTTLTLVREAESAPWQLAVNGAIVDEPIDMDVAQRLIDALALVQATGAADPKRDLSTAKAAAVIELAGEPGTLTLDVADDGGSYYLRQRGSAHAVTVDKQALAEVVGVTKEALIKKPNPSPSPSSPFPQGPE